jgi:hypothetical protein
LRCLLDMPALLALREWFDSRAAMDLPFDVRQAVIVGAIAVCVAVMRDYGEHAAQQAVAREREHTVMMRMRERGDSMRTRWRPTC